MASIWKELMFLHGHFVRADDLLDEALAAAAKAAAVRDSRSVREALPDGDALACGGCS